MTRDEVKPPLPPPSVIFLDRSRMQDAHNCMRLRWWRYHFAGRGLSPAAGALPLLDGDAIHRGIEALLKGEAIEAILPQLLGTLEHALRAGVQLETVDEAFVKEQLCLVECLLRAWEKVRLQDIRQEFEIVRVEPEVRWEMAPGMIDLIRPDTLLRRRADARLFYREWKTTASGGSDWAAGWEHTSQALANVAGLQEVLHERIWGMEVEGLLKGRRDKEKRKTSQFHGKRIQQSFLCYAWRRDGELWPEWRYGSEHVRVWEECTSAAWVERLGKLQKLEELFVHVMPVVPSAERLAAWKRQEIAKEKRIASSLALLGPTPSEEQLDEFFPRNEDHCLRYWGYPCAFEKACFTTQVAKDPIGSGLYRIRVPHHRAEREKFSLDGGAGDV